MATVVLRTNYMCDALHAMINTIKNAGIGILIAADFSEGSFDACGFDVIEISKDALHRNHLFVGIPNPVWQCGDYILYMAMQRCPREDKFWHIESDVRFNMKNVDEFFCKVHASSVDCALVSFAKSSEDWHWYRGTSQQGLDVYRCRFPVVFATRQVIAHAYQLRINQSMRMRKKTQESPEFAKALAYDRTLWPNDEGFFASAAKDGNFIVEDFNKFGYFYSSKTFRYEPAFLQDDFEEMSSDEKIYHPVLDFEHYIKKFLRHKRPEILAAFSEETERLCTLGYSRERIAELKGLYW